MKYELLYYYYMECESKSFESKIDLYNLILQNKSADEVEVLASSDLKETVCKLLNEFNSEESPDLDYDIDDSIEKELQAEIDQGIIVKEDFENKKRLKNIFDADLEFASSMSCSGEVEEVWNKSVMLLQLDDDDYEKLELSFTIGEFFNLTGFDCTGFSSMDNTMALIDEYLDKCNVDDFNF